ncbi:phosphatidylethanolamine-binding protein homolog F40A3.3-like [Episyrphus balteatus]|uniref:phosphatidylethanolamine-binding protein homolog F40A3.3-like n=1 Tax=Episyrphus balteatus TaxID=286459 RepID=UPI0024857E3E|nr:phosphatidylethanolamine-binding protein homolog F40A3.3-like [Episyrphus balteatus]
MQEAKIVPDAIDVAPTKVLQITYPNGVVVKQGNDLTPTQVKDQPTLHWDADEYKLYTLLMTDLDPPREMTEVCHWLVVNIPGNKILEGQTVMEFVGSGPSLGSGKHRYVFFVFEQANAIKTNVFITKTTIEGRINKATRDLIKEYNLGVPVAGNFYWSEYDDYVPFLHATFNK